jgi:hypothetical protein
MEILDGEKVCIMEITWRYLMVKNGITWRYLMVKKCVKWKSHGDTKRRKMATTSRY